MARHKHRHPVTGKFVGTRTDSAGDTYKPGAKTDSRGDTIAPGASKDSRGDFLKNVMPPKRKAAALMNASKKR